MHKKRPACKWLAEVKQVFVMENGVVSCYAVFLFFDHQLVGFCKELFCVFIAAVIFKISGIHVENQLVKNFGIFFSPRRLMVPSVSNHAVKFLFVCAWA